MSRIGLKPIPLPAGVDVKIGPGSQVLVAGPRGQLDRVCHPDMTIALEDGTLVVRRPSDSKLHRALHGLTRSLLANMVAGVTAGFEKRLEIQGTGYRAEFKNQRLEFALGYSHPVVFEAPAGVELAVEGVNVVVVRGSDKEAVGQTAANIRKLRPVEPYKGKGVRYAGVHVRRRAGKAGKVGAKG